MGARNLRGVLHHLSLLILCRTLTGIGPKTDAAVASRFRHGGVFAKTSDKASAETVAIQLQIMERSNWKALGQHSANVLRPNQLSMDAAIDISPIKEILPRDISALKVERPIQADVMAFRSAETKRSTS